MSQFTQFLKSNPRIIAMSKPGAGKSHLAASFASVERPMQVFMFDPLGKDLPYLRVGEQVVREGDETLVLNEDGEPIIRITYFHEEEPEVPVAWEQFRSFLVEKKHLAAVNDRAPMPAAWVLDSASMLELAARGYSRYRLNPNTKEPRQHWSFATDCMEQVFLQRFSRLPGAVFVLCHIDSDKDERDGSYVYNPKLPGRLRDNAALGYTEVWRVHTLRDKKGTTTRVVQTQPCEKYGCMTNWGVPDGLPNNFASLLA